MSGDTGEPSSILVAVDASSDVDVLLATLSDREALVRVARSGADAALEEARASPPSLVLLDELETCRRLRQLPGFAQIPILAIVESADPADAVRALDAGADDYLTRPLQRAAVLARVRIHLSLSELRRKLAQIDGSPGPDDGVMTLKALERAHFIAVLRRTRGVIEGPKGAARLLDLKPSTARFRMKKLGISRHDYLAPA